MRVSQRGVFGVKMFEYTNVVNINSDLFFHLKCGEIQLVCSILCLSTADTTDPKD